MLATIWAKIGKGLTLLASVVLTAAGVCWYAFTRGEKHQAQRDAAAHQQDAAQAAEQTQATQTDAAQAVVEVTQHAQAAPPPDTKARNDFDSTE